MVSILRTLPLHMPLTLGKGALLGVCVDVQVLCKRLRYYYKRHQGFYVGMISILLSKLVQVQQSMLYHLLSTRLGLSIRTGEGNGDYYRTCWSAP